MHLECIAYGASTVFHIFLKTSYMQGRDTCTGRVMKIRTAGSAQRIQHWTYSQMYYIAAVSPSQGPTVAVRNALVAGNNPLTAFSFLHPECDGKR